MSGNHLYDGVFAPFAASRETFLLTESGKTGFAEFTELTDRLAYFLANQGVGPGDRVAAQTGKSVTLLALYAATVKAGGVYLPLNTDYTAAELDYFIKDAAPRMVVLEDARLEDAATSDELHYLVESVEGKLTTLNPDGSGTATELADALSLSVHSDLPGEKPLPFEAVPRGPDDLAAILYTSGTTGRSKGARLTHENLLSNTRVLKEAWKFTGEDTLLHMLPIYHTHGLFVACNLLAMVGGSMIFLPKFDADAAIRWMPRATTMMGVPTFYTRLLGREDFTRDLAGHMRLFISGSAPLLAETHARFQERTGMAILERYGMTETSMSASNPHDGERRAGTVGLPLAGIEIRITDAKTGDPLPDGEIGVLEQRGPNVFDGYWRMPEKTREAFREDGFFITGDLARRDADGYLTIVGRDKDLIITGGLNVYPKEVEGVLDAMDGVVESAVIGVPHPDFGEAVVAVVVREDKDLEAATLEAAVGQALAKFKQPKSYQFVDALPRNSMGKVQKNVLRETHCRLFERR